MSAYLTRHIREISTHFEYYRCSKYLQDDKEDFALRLSSNLMVGIARVYRLQTDILYTDINHVLVNFKRALYSLQQAPLDMTVTEVAAEKITLPLKELDRIIGLNDEFVFKVPLPVNRNQQPGEGRGSDTTSQSTLSLAGAASNVALDQTILSYQSQTSHFSVGDPLGFPSSSLQGISTKSSFSADEKGKEWTDLDPLLRAVPSSDKTGRAGSEDDFLLGAAEPLNLFDTDQGVFNDDYGDFDFQIQKDGERDAEDVEDLFLLKSDTMEIDKNMEEDEKSDRTLSLQEKTPDKTPKRPAKKKMFSLIDEQISLTDSELHQMRLNAPLLLKENELDMIKEDRRKQSLIQIANAKDYSIRCFPSSLQAFLRQNQARPDNPLCALRNSLKISDGEADEGNQADDEWQEQQGRGASRKRKMVDDFQNDDYGDYDMPARLEPEVEDERDLSLEVGRAASELASMPWHAPRSDTGTQSSARGSKRGGRTSRNLPSTPIRRERASDSSLPFDFESHHGPSSTSNVQEGILELGGFDESSFEKIVREGSDRTNGGEISDAETRAFYEYIVMLAEETGSTSVFLLDICIDQPRKTAAAAFYNVLRCAGEGHVKVRQADADVEIIVFSQ